MGIQKALSTAYGVPAIHWQITKVKIDYVSQCVHVTLEGRNVKTAETALMVKEYDIGTVNLPKAQGLARDITAYLLTTITDSVPFSEFYLAPEET